MRLIHHTITYGALVLAALCTPGCSNDGEELSTAKMLLAQGTDQSEQAACQIFFKLAEDGDADAQFHLALCLRNGWGVQRTV
ncbi:MAG: hypothetical protein RJA05_1887, partial [Planctomycetota bacterium]